MLIEDLLTARQSDILLNRPNILAIPEDDPDAVKALNESTIGRGKFDFSRPAGGEIVERVGANVRLSLRWFHPRP